MKYDVQKNIEKHKKNQQGFCPVSSSPITGVISRRKPHYIIQVQNIAILLTDGVYIPFFQGYQPVHHATRA